MKKGMLCASLISMITCGCTVYAEEVKTYKYRIILDYGEKVEYALFQDENGESPILDENEKPLIVETDERGAVKIVSPLEKVYAKQVSAPDGYYADDTVYALNLYTAIYMNPIDISFSSDIYPAQFEIVDASEEIIAQWEATEQSKASNGENEVVFRCGEKYQLKDTNQTEGLLNNPISFEIPQTMPEEPLLVEYTHVSYGTLNIQVKDETQGKENVEYRLFVDEACTQVATDIYGEQVILKTDQDGNASSQVEGGKYFLKQIDVDEKYYLSKEIKEVNIERAKTVSLTDQCKKIEVKVEMRDASSKQVIAGKVRFTSGDEEFVSESGESVLLKRGTGYSVEDAEHPLGFYGFQSMTYTVSEFDEGEDVITLQCVPYQVEFVVKDEDTSQVVIGGRYQILDVDEKEVESFALDEEGFHTSDLKEGNTYTLHQVSARDGYTLIKDQTFSIPASFDSENEHQIHVEANTIPFSYLSAGVLDENSAPIETAAVSLFEDQACKKQAKDLYGNTLASMHTSQKFAIRNGTYYAKVTQLDEGYYLPVETITCLLNHESGLQKHVSFNARSVHANVKITDEEGNSLEGIEVKVIDENKEEILTVTSSTDNTSVLSNVLERGKDYYLSISKTQGRYTYDKNEMKLSIPSSYESQTPEVKFECVPYVRLNVIQKDQTGNTYGLYIDENCQVLAKDINDSFTKKTIQANGKISWDLRDGTYYLKEVESTGSSYKNSKIDKIVIDSSTSFESEIQRSNSQVKLQLEIKDQNGKALRDGEYEIQNENGEVLFTVTNFDEVLSGKWLQPNKTYVFHETKTPDGYQANQTDVMYTIPSAEPNEIPVIEIEYEKEVSPKAALEKKKVEVVEEIKESFHYEWIVYALLAMVSVVGVAYFMLHKKASRSE